ncbi:MAG TPA: C39 family peptidase [Anaerolineaceae bacterium]|nr:C39 family peptidase [Anaerolineaceae bacterium]
MAPRQGSPTSRLILNLIVIIILVLAGCIPAEVAPPLTPTSPTVELPGSSPTFPVTPTTKPTLLVQPTSQPTPTVTESAIPSSAMITTISGHEQTYELGCEASAAVDWAGYFGVLIYESSFQFELPLSDNPELGFVGNVTTDGWGQIPPDAYGVHAPPIAELLREYGLPAQAVRGMTLEDVKSELAEGDPIIAWVIGNMVYSDPVKYIDKQGNAVTVAPYEHVVILVGYDETTITYMNNGFFYSVPTEVFLTSWGVLGNMAVIHD